jgi:hypothetical protein
MHQFHDLILSDNSSITPVLLSPCKCHAVITVCRKPKGMRLGIASKCLMCAPNFIKSSQLVQNLRCEHSRTQSMWSRKFTLLS